jgi:DNA-binding beta-propeller fold protein YncE
MNKIGLAGEGDLRKADTMKTNQFIFLKKSGPNLPALALVLSLLAPWAMPAAHAKEVDKGPKYMFFPPAPDEPRVQFLTSFDTEKDLRKGKHDSFMTFLTGQPPKLLPIVKPYGGAAGGGKLYVCDTGQNAVLKMDLVAQKMSVVSPDVVDAIESPVNLAVDTNGWLYVVDLIRQQLVILNDKENLVGTVGEKRQNRPLDVALTGDRIYLSDSLQHCVHVLDKATRTNLFDIPHGADGTNVQRKLFQPINIALDQQGRLYVSDFGAYRVQVYDPEGNYLRSIGDHGNNFGEFSRNKGVAVDHENIVYVVDAAGDMVQMFNDQGQLLMWFGGAKANQASMELPAKVLVDYDDVALFQKYASPDFKVEHLLIVMNQFGPHKVAVFGFGHKK